jgi:hypothetical protein
MYNRLLPLILLAGAAVLLSGCTDRQYVNELEKKYGVEFEAVENTELSQDLVTKTMNTLRPTKEKILREKGSPAVVFKASGSPTEIVWEDYLEARWGEELRQEFKDTFKASLPKGSLYRVTVRPDIYDKYDWTPSTKDLNAREYLSKFQETAVDVEIVIPVTGELNLADYSQGLYNLFYRFEDEIDNDYFLDIAFVEAPAIKEAEQSFNLLYQISEYENYKVFGITELMYRYARNSDPEDKKYWIEKPEDIEQFFRKYEQ